MGRVVSGVHAQTASRSILPFFAGPPNMVGSIGFVRWRYCAPPCNTCFLGPILVYNETASRSVHPFIHSSRQRVEIVQKRLSLSPLKIAPSHRGTEPHLIRDSLGLPESSTQTGSRSFQPFLHRYLQIVLILYNGTPLPPSKLFLPLRMWTPYRTEFLGSTRVLNPNGIWIGSAVFAGHTTVTD